MKLNVIIPCYNEDGNILIFHEKISEVLKEIKYRLIFINDGSSDKTEEKLVSLYNKDKNHIRIINFSRNFGKEAAMYAGLIHSNAEYTCILDADLQHNPNYLLKMIDILDNNPEYDQVCMINKKRTNEIFLAKILKKLFYKIINKISDTEFKTGASDFRMFRKNVVEAINSLKENNRFSKGIFSWVGFNTKYIPYSVEKRYSGKSKFNIIKSFKYAWHGILNFSIQPLKLATRIGTIISSCSFIYLIYIFIDTLITGSKVPGYPSLICIILLLGGLNLLAIGILGEYISKMYLEVKNRPIYVAKNKIGFDDEIL